MHLVTDVGPLGKRKRPYKESPFRNVVGGGVDVQQVDCYLVSACPPGQ